MFFYRHSCSELRKPSSKPAASLLPDVTTESELKVFVAQSCPTLCDPMDCSPPGSSVHGIFQAKILEWVAVPSCRGSNPGLLHCRSILYHLSHQGSCRCKLGSPRKTTQSFLKRQTLATSSFSEHQIMKTV